MNLNENIDRINHLMAFNLKEQTKPQLKTSVPDYKYAGATTAETLSNETMHTINTFVGIGSAFIPIIGPFLSAGVGLQDASQYYEEGDKKTAGMVAMFALLPAVGNLVSKIPAISRLGAKGMTALAAKLSKSGTQGLSTVEKEVVEGLAANKSILQTELNNTVKSIASNVANKNVLPKTKQVLNSIKKFGINTTKDVAKYGAAGAAYNVTYDALSKDQEQDNINKLYAMVGYQPKLTTKKV